MQPRLGAHVCAWRMLFAAVVCADCALVLTLAAPGLDSQPSPVLRGILLPSEVQRGALQEGEVHAFEFHAESGSFLQVVLEQQGIDLALKLTTLDGRTIADGDARWDGPEPLSAVADAGGTYRVLVSRVGRAQLPAEYSINLGVPRNVQSTDLRRIDAERVSSAAKARVGVGTAQALREALGLLDKAVSDWRDIEDRSGQAAALNTQGYVRNLLGESQRALGDFEAAIPLWRALGDGRGEAETLGNIAAAHSALGNKPLAVQLYEEAHAIASRARARRVDAHVLMNLANVSWSLGEYDRALATLPQALNAWRAIGDPTGEAFAIDLEGVIKLSLGDRQEALDRFTGSADRWRRLGNVRGEAVAINNMGQISAAFGERDRAVEAYQRALSLTLQVGDARLQAQILSNLAIVSPPTAAMDYYMRALELARQAGDRFHEAVVQINIAEVEHRGGRTAAAIERGLAAVELARVTGNRRVEAAGLHNLGLFHASLQRFAEAREYYRRALDLARQVNDLDTEAKILQHLAVLPGDFDERQQLAEQAISIAESMRSRIFRRDLRITYSSALRQFYETYVDLLMQRHVASPTEGFDRQAFTAADQARARGLIEMLRERDAAIGETANTQHQAEERRLSRSLRAKAAALDRLAGPARPVEEKRLRGEVERLLEDYEKLQVDVRRSHPQYATLLAPPRPALADIQRELDAETHLIAYWLGATRSYVWMVSPTEIVARALAPGVDIEEAARSLHRAVSPRPVARANGRRATDAAAAKVSQLVLEPLGPFPRGVRLVFVPDGALQLVPLAALPYARSSGLTAPLIRNHEIAVLPSVGALTAVRAARAERPRPPLTAAVLADPVYNASDSRVKRPSAPVTATHPASLQRALEDVGGGQAVGLGSLPYSRAEADTIARLTPGRHLRAVDFAASRATAMRSDLGQYRIVHFATHTVFNAVHPDLSGIVLSLVDRDGKPQDGFLRLHEIYAMQLPIDLVVLSACRSALGREVMSEGLIGLTRGFMYAGASSIIGSLWKVDDQATSILMRSFYEGLLGARRLHPVAALREAQLALSRDPRWREPYYWSAFFLQGEFSRDRWISTTSTR